MRTVRALKRTLFNWSVSGVPLTRDLSGQDLIEYALMAGFVAVTAGALMPGVSTYISTILSKTASVLIGAKNREAEFTAYLRTTGAPISCFISAALRDAFCCIGPGMLAACSLNFWASASLDRSLVNLLIW